MFYEAVFGFRQRPSAAARSERQCCSCFTASLGLPKHAGNSLFSFLPRRVHIVEERHVAARVVSYTCTTFRTFQGVEGVGRVGGGIMTMAERSRVFLLLLLLLLLCLCFTYCFAKDIWAAVMPLACLCFRYGGY